MGVLLCHITLKNKVEMQNLIPLLKIDPFSLTLALLKFTAWGGNFLRRRRWTGVSCINLDRVDGSGSSAFIGASGIILSCPLGQRFVGRLFNFASHLLNDRDNLTILDNCIDVGLVSSFCVNCIFDCHKHWYHGVHQPLTGTGQQWTLSFWKLYCQSRAPTSHPGQDAHSPYHYPRTPPALPHLLSTLTRSIPRFPLFLPVL